ncbi:beta-lactamase family protein [Streptomyces yatensis]|nr:beta-lactamase family protein [Streptomyces yatensis]
MLALHLWQEGHVFVWEHGIVSLWNVSTPQLSLLRSGEMYWPDFAANGKEHIEVRHLLSHTSGVSGWETPFSTEDTYDWDFLTGAGSHRSPHRPHSRSTWRLWTPRARGSRPSSVRRPIPRTRTFRPGDAPTCPRSTATGTHGPWPESSRLSRWAAPSTAFGCCRPTRSG